MCMFSSVLWTDQETFLWICSLTRLRSTFLNFLPHFQKLIHIIIFWSWRDIQTFWYLVNWHPKQKWGTCTLSIAGSKGGTQVLLSAPLKNITRVPSTFNILPFHTLKWHDTMLSCDKDICGDRDPSQRGYIMCSWTTSMVHKESKILMSWGPCTMIQVNGKPQLRLGIL